MRRRLLTLTSCLATATVLFQGIAFCQGIKESFVAEGMSQKMGGYRPIRAEMIDESKGIAKAPEGLSAPKYGRIEIDGKSWAFILDEPK